MYGKNRYELILCCVVCGRQIAVQVDPEDVLRHEQGELVQDAMPYLSPEERELFVSGVCGDPCWPLLCPSSKLDYN
ncbi:MAG: hypothetical protein WB538_17990 [Candidatus Sulfotelmatobacter sp.]